MQYLYMFKTQEIYFSYVTIAMSHVFWIEIHLPLNEVNLVFYFIENIALFRQNDWSLSFCFT